MALKTLRNPKGAGRQRHSPTDELRRRVGLYAAFGNSTDQIAEILGISPTTVRLHYSQELKLGRVQAANAVKLNLYQLATQKDFKALRAIELYLRYIERTPTVVSDAPAVHLGKKEQAAQVAMRAHEESEWGDVLKPLGRPN